jgi:transcriptional regulator with XRE-family HTH domain
LTHKSVDHKLFRMIRPRKPRAGVRTDLGLSIRQLRLSFGITQGHQVLNTTPHTISRWETGVHKPSLSDLESLAHFFGVPIERMFPQAELSPQMRVLITLSCTGMTLSESIFTPSSRLDCEIEAPVIAKQERKV